MQNDRYEKTTIKDDFIQDKDTDDPVIETDIRVVGEETLPKKSKTAVEDSEQFEGSIVIGKKEYSFEDGRNVISVIINAISVRINMPRGTVKTLIACFAALIVVALAFAGSAVSNKAEDKTVSEKTEPVTETSEPSTEDTDNTHVGDDVLALKDYVNISAHFYYRLPDNVKAVWEPEELYAENETFCDFTYDDDWYTIRSYVLEYNNNDLADIVKADLSLFDNMAFIDEEYFDGKYGEILKIRFESIDEKGNPIVGTGYYWYESVPKICCLEVSSDSWRDGEVENMIINSIYRVSSGTTAPYAVDEDEAWSNIQEEEAMNSIVEDAMRDYYEQKPDPSDRVLKP